jgi:hypothetical protein
MVPVGVGQDDGDRLEAVECCQEAVRLVARIDHDGSARAEVAQQPAVRIERANHDPADGKAGAGVEVLGLARDSHRPLGSGSATC